VNYHQFVYLHQLLTIASPNCSSLYLVPRVSLEDIHDLLCDDTEVFVLDQVPLQLNLVLFLYYDVGIERFRLRSCACCRLALRRILLVVSTVLHPLPDKFRGEDVVFELWRSVK